MNRKAIVERLFETTIIPLSYAISAVIIFFAILICIARILTPILDDHKNDVELWASTLLGTPITIEQVELAWFQYSPEITLKKVTVLNAESKEPILQIQKIRVFLSLFQSLLQQKIVTNEIMLTGTDIDLHKSTNGEISIKGFPAFGGFSQQPYAKEAKFSEVIAWLGQQEQLYLQNIDVRYTGPRDEKKYITLENLRLKNKEESHKLVGKFILHQDIPTEVIAAFRWRGNELELETLNAKAYLYVTGLSLQQWIKGYSFKNIEVDNGIANAKIWLNWKDGHIQQWQSIFQVYDMSFHFDKIPASQLIKRISGHIGWKKAAATQTEILAAEDLLLDLPQHLWPATKFYFKYKTDADSISPQLFSINYIHLQDTIQLLKNSPFKDDIQKYILPLNLQGELRDTHLMFPGAVTDWQLANLTTHFNLQHFSAADKTFVLKNAAGRFHWENSRGHLSLASKNLNIHYIAYFEKPLTFQKVNSEIDLNYTNGQWLFATPALQLTSGDGDATLKGSLQFSNTIHPQLDLDASFNIHKIENISQYLPAKTFDRELSHWLKAAFLSGKLAQGEAKLQGDLAGFPYAHSTGIFTLKGKITDLRLHYAPNWPDLNKAEGNIFFDRDTFHANIEKMEILNNSVSTIDATIKNLGSSQAQLTVTKNQFATDIKHLLKFISESPLREDLGNLDHYLTMKGPAILDLQLIIPLLTPEKTQVKGSLGLQNNQFSLKDIALPIQNLNGTIGFTEANISSTDLQGQWFNHPINLSLKTQGKATITNFSTFVAVKDLESLFKTKVDNYLQGATDIQGTVSVEGAQVKANIKSFLHGIKISVADYKKAADAKNDFNLDIIMQEGAPIKLKFDYDKFISAAGILDRVNQNYQLSSATLHFGNGSASWPDQTGLFITANIGKIDWNKISSFIHQAKTTSSDKTKLILRGFSARIDDFVFGGNHLRRLQLSGSESQGVLDLSIDSAELNNGRIKIPYPLQKSGILKATFDKINFPKQSSNDSAISSINLKELPTIDVQVNSLSYDNMNFGTVNFHAVPADNGLAIEWLRMTSPVVTLEAKGEWIQSGSEQTTKLVGNANTKNLSGLLSSLNFKVPNFIGHNATVNFDLRWRGPVYSPAIANLSGVTSLTLGPGRIVDIGSESGAKMDLGRMLSIFSLQTIPRRLSFDFSDVTQKGYSFDFLRGDLSLTSGVLETKNLTFDGPVAKVGIHGRIGLSKRNYDCVLIVTPHVTSSIPLAATILTAQPLIGLAALAVNTVIGSQVSKVITYHYTIQGTWDNPVWKSVQVSTPAKR